MILGRAKGLVRLDALFAIALVDFVARFLHEQPELGGEHAFIRCGSEALVVPCSQKGMGIVDRKRLPRACVSLFQIALHICEAFSDKRLSAVHPCEILGRNLLYLFGSQLFEIIVGKHPIERRTPLVHCNDLADERRIFGGKTFCHGHAYHLVEGRSTGREGECIADRP